MPDRDELLARANELAVDRDRFEEGTQWWGVLNDARDIVLDQLYPDGTGTDDLEDDLDAPKPPPPAVQKAAPPPPEPVDPTPALERKALEARAALEDATAAR